MNDQLLQVNLLIQKGDLHRAEIILNACLEKDSKDINALNILATMYLRQNKLEESLLLFKEASSIAPNAPSIAYNLASVLMHLHRHAEALQYHEKAARLDHNSYWVNINYGISLYQLGKPDEALELFYIACKINPDIAQGWSNCGNALQCLGRYDDALVAYDKALQLRPSDYPEAWSNRGVVLQKLKHFDLALESFDKALELRSDYAQAWFNKGITFSELFKNQDSLFCFTKAIESQLNYPEAYLNAALIHCEIRDYKEALVVVDKAISLAPNYNKAWNHRGVITHQLGLYDLSLASFKRANELDSACDYLLGNLLTIQLHLCDWTDLELQTAQLITKIALGEKAAIPSHVIPLIDSGPLQKQIAQTWVADKHLASDDLPPLLLGAPKAKGAKIRLGYYSADFHNHATMYLMAKLFEAHDHSQFELFAFSFGPFADDAMRKRAVAAFDHFIDVKDQSDLEIAKLSRQLQIDIAVDLKGFTPFARTNIFAHRAAPVQVNYLGYPGTMGASYMDYIIADRVLVPPGSEQFYTEKVVYMPHSYQVNDDQRVIADTVYTRTQLGLPDTGFVFCCFNNNYKILPPTFDGWLRILKAVPDSVLWLLEDNPTAAKNLQQIAMNKGLDPVRLIFAKRMPLAEHLARHRLADLFLDTLPCNAHTTTSDALWAGLPVLTLPGETFASRVSASLLNAIGLPELIANTQVEYEKRAIDLAQSPEILAQIKGKLMVNRKISPLFDTKQYAKDLEGLYIYAYKNPL